MQKVLLAVEGLCPEKRILDYAAGLCRRIKAELNILHIVEPRAHAGYVKDLQRQVHQARDAFENTMMAAAFAETGDFHTARSLADKAAAHIHGLLSNADKTELTWRIQVNSGKPGPEIVNYVRKHRDVILAIYDEGAYGDEGSDGNEWAPADPGRDRSRENAAALPACREKPAQAPGLSLSELQRELPVPLVVRRPDLSKG